MGGGGADGLCDSDEWFRLPLDVDVDGVPGALFPQLQVWVVHLFGVDTPSHIFFLFALCMTDSSNDASLGTAFLYRDRADVIVRTCCKRHAKKFALPKK